MNNERLPIPEEGRNVRRTLFYGSIIIAGVVSLVALTGLVALGNREGRIANAPTNLVQKVESPYEPNFSRSKILTVSARDYVESRGKKLEDYVMIGVSGAANNYSGKRIWEVPKGSEVVVDCKPKNDYVEMGTALVPREKTK